MTRPLTFGASRMVGSWNVGVRERLANRVLRGAHQRRVERARDLQADGLGAARARGLLGAFDRRDGAGQHDLLRGVLVRDLEHVAAARHPADLGGVGGGEPDDRGHPRRRGVRGLLHGPAAGDHDTERVDVGQHAGGDQGDELPERMPGRPLEARALGLQHAERGEVAGEQRRLDQLGGGERRGVAAELGEVAVPRRGQPVEHGSAGLVVIHGSAMPSNWDPWPGNRTAARTATAPRPSRAATLGCSTPSTADGYKRRPGGGAGKSAALFGQGPRRRRVARAGRPRNSPTAHTCRVAGLSGRAASTSLERLPGLGRRPGGRRRMPRRRPPGRRPGATPASCRVPPPRRRARGSANR